MQLPPRFITILCLVQLFFIGAGVGLTRIFLKMFDQFVPPMFGKYTPHLPALLQLFRYQGLWLFLLPLLWCGFAVFRRRQNTADATITPGQFLTGLLLTAVLFLTFGYCTLAAFSYAYCSQNFDLARVR
ncbi:MAG: hypothetical protein QM796_15835 [Chthoniobacteraceae bacterium]